MEPEVCGWWPVLKVWADFCLSIRHMNGPFIKLVEIPGEFEKPGGFPGGQGIENTHVIEFLVF